jgi:hypothetical protein
LRVTKNVDMRNSFFLCQSKEKFYCHEFTEIVGCYPEVGNKGYFCSGIQKNDTTSTTPEEGEPWVCTIEKIPRVRRGQYRGGGGGCFWGELREGVEDGKGGGGNFGRGGINVIKDGMISGKPDAPSCDEREGFVGRGGGGGELGV